MRTCQGKDEFCFRAIGISPCRAPSDPTLKVVETSLSTKTADNLQIDLVLSETGITIPELTPKSFHTVPQKLYGFDCNVMVVMYRTLTIQICMATPYTHVSVHFCTLLQERYQG